MNRKPVPVSSEVYTAESDASQEQTRKELAKPERTDAAKQFHEILENDKAKGDGT